MYADLRTGQIGPPSLSRILPSGIEAQVHVELLRVTQTGSAKAMPNSSTRGFGRRPKTPRLPKSSHQWTKQGHEDTTILVVNMLYCAVVAQRTNPRKTQKWISHVSRFSASLETHELGMPRRRACVCDHIPCDSAHWEIPRAPGGCDKPSVALAVGRDSGRGVLTNAGRINRLPVHARTAECHVGDTAVAAGREVVVVEENVPEVDVRMPAGLPIDAGGHPIRLHNHIGQRRQQRPVDARVLRRRNAKHIASPVPFVASHELHAFGPGIAALKLTRWFSPA